jgi:hypothetical protein
MDVYPPMEILEGRILSKYLLDKYSKNPKGWSFTMFPSSKDEAGFIGAFVSGPEEVWQLKIDSIFKPNPLMIGTKTELDSTKVKRLGAVPYGYRKIDAPLLRNLLKLLDEEKGPEGKTPDLDRLLAPVETVVPEGGTPYAEGPFILTNRENAGVSDSQKSLEDRLSAELRRLLRNKYQSYG